MTSWKDVIYIVGGDAKWETVGTFIYDIQNDLWSFGPDLIETRIYHSCNVADGAIYVIGGTEGGYHVVHATIEKWDFLNDPEGTDGFKYLNGATLNPGRHRHRSLSIGDGRILITGGRAGPWGSSYDLDNVDVLYTRGNDAPRIESLTSLFFGARMLHMVLQIDNYFMVMGGYNGGNVKYTVWEVTNTLPTSMPTQRPTTNPTTAKPTKDPTIEPTVDPTYDPTMDPTVNPTNYPTRPSVDPTVNPTNEPSSPTTHNPTEDPTDKQLSDSETDSAGGNADTNSDSGLMMILIVVGSVVLVICIIILVYYLRCRNRNAIVIKNPMVVLIAIGEYEKDENDCDQELMDSEFQDLPVNIDVGNLVQLFDADAYNYAIHRSHQDNKQFRLKWKEQELIDFLKEKAAFFDSNVDKFDGLMVVISCHGLRDYVCTSDYKLIEKLAIHRLFSLNYPKVRELPRIFIYDCCDGDNDYGKGINSMTDTGKGREIKYTKMNLDDTETGDIEMGKNFRAEHIEKQNEAIWERGTKNPDYLLVEINAANPGFESKMSKTKGSYMISKFVEKMMKNLNDNNPRFIHQIFDDIQEELQKKQQTKNTYNNGAMYCVLKKNAN